MVRRIECCEAFGGFPCEPGRARCADDHCELVRPGVKSTSRLFGAVVDIIMAARNVPPSMISPRSRLRPGTRGPKAEWRPCAADHEGRAVRLPNSEQPQMPSRHCVRSV